jgi:RNA-dependent RNA polymerase
LDSISLRLKIPNLSVIQIRYKGAKGLLTLDTTLPKNTIHLRPSMIKYACKHPHSDKYLDILSWNMYKGGFLNRQIIILLRTRGIPDEVFMTLQKRYIDDIQKMSYRECTIYKELTDPDGDEALYNLEPANKIIRNLCQTGFELDKEPFFKGILKILKRNGYQKLLEKSNINVDKSARLVGVNVDLNIGD